MTNKLELDDAPTTLLFDKQNSRKVVADKPKQSIPDRIYVAPCALAMAAQALLNSQDPDYRPNNRPQF